MSRKCLPKKRSGEIKKLKTKITLPIVKPFFELGSKNVMPQKSSFFTLCVHSFIVFVG